MYHFLVVITLLYKKLFFIQVFNKPFNSSRLRTIWLQLCFVAAFLLTSPYFPVFAEDTKQVEIFAYHGVLEDVPENTFAALRRVAELGVDGVAIVVGTYRRVYSWHNLYKSISETSPSSSIKICLFAKPDDNLGHEIRRHAFS